MIFIVKGATQRKGKQALQWMSFVRSLIFIAVKHLKSDLAANRTAF